MYEEMQIRKYSPRSIENYISNVSSVSSHFGKSPDLISIAELKEYLFYKVETKNLSASSVNQTIIAFKILSTHYGIHLPPIFWNRAPTSG
jgi:hypothetical protein